MKLRTGLDRIGFTACGAMLRTASASSRSIKHHECPPRRGRGCGRGRCDTLPVRRLDGTAPGFVVRPDRATTTHTRLTTMI